ncbi:MAG TPA: HAD-IA family hydrolase [Clostridia bacterium]|nr:HAD-IA family hydrolase [Clostridia bacterium]
MQSLIFDFDGTIINTNNLIIQTLKKVAKDKLNLTLEEEKINEMYGLAIDEQMRMLDPNREDELVDYYFDLYLRKVNSETFLFEGIEELLKELNVRNYSLYILTNNNTKDTTQSLDRLNILNYFEGMITMDDVSNGKPDPEGLQILFNNNNIDKNKALLIGDSPHDIEAGDEFNIKTVLVGWTMFDLEDFKVKPDQIINKPGELLELI